MNEDSATRAEPFVRFRIDTERMPDGRSIHYYEWPPEEAATTDAPPGDRPADADDGPESGR